MLRAQVASKGSENANPNTVQPPCSPPLKSHSSAPRHVRHASTKCPFRRTRPTILCLNSFFLQTVAVKRWPSFDIALQ